MLRNQRLNPANKNPVRVVERPSEAEPEHGHAIALSPTPNEHSRRAEWMRLLWQERSFIGRTTILGLIFSLVVAFLLPVQYKSKMRLMRIKHFKRQRSCWCARWKPGKRGRRLARSEEFGRAFCGHARWHDDSR